MSEYIAPYTIVTLIINMCMSPYYKLRQILKTNYNLIATIPLANVWSILKQVLFLIQIFKIAYQILEVTLTKFDFRDSFCYILLINIQIRYCDSQKKLYTIDTILRVTKFYFFDIRRMPEKICQYCQYKIWFCFYKFRTLAMKQF